MKTLRLLLMSAFTFFAISAFAQDSTAQKSKKTIYTCSMHPTVKSDKPGKCPKCGMDLVKATADQAKVYVCPMHPEVTSNKPGKCPKCKMALKLKKEGTSGR